MVQLKDLYRSMRRAARTGGRLTTQLRRDFVAGSAEGLSVGRFNPLPPSQGGRAEALALPQTVYLHGSEGSTRVPWPAYPPEHYLGQLDPGFQERLAADRAYVTREDCDFYHTAELPDGEVVLGPWDLRGRERDYLGGIDVKGRRVIELGPASGYMTFSMERSGADVVALDVGWDKCVDLMPRPGVELSWARMDFMRYIGAVQNSWWYLHRAYGSNARMVYGSVYDVPADVGTFDCAFFGAILLHLRDPFAALSAVADHVSSTIVVTDVVQDPDLDQRDNLLRFAPQDIRYPTHWWSMTPGAVIRMLERLGFSTTELTFHTQRHHLDHNLDSPPTELDMFSVVGRRP